MYVGSWVMLLLNVECLVVVGVWNLFLLLFLISMVLCMVLVLVVVVLISVCIVMVFGEVVLVVSICWLW